MAIYHLRVKVMSRGKGHSAVHAAAYRSGEKLSCERSGKTYDYTRKGHVGECFIMTPTVAHEWASVRQEAWNEVERVEKRKDARLAREIEVALPRELDAESCVALLREFAQRHFVDKGMIADICIHRPPTMDGSGENPHAHIMLTTRAITKDGFGAKVAAWNKVELLEEWRKEWMRAANAALERRGVDERIDHRTLVEQRAEAIEQGDHAKAASLTREPVPHLGIAARVKELTGRVKERFNSWVAVKHRNRLLPQLEAMKGRDMTAFVRQAAMLIDDKAFELGLHLRPPEPRLAAEHHGRMQERDIDLER